jgi:hypothetical protein
LQRTRRYTATAKVKSNPAPRGTDEFLTRPSLSASDGKPKELIREEPCLVSQPRAIGTRYEKSGNISNYLKEREKRGE